MRNKLTFLLLMCSFHFANCQVTTGFNFGGGTDYVGWDLPTNLPLEIKNEATHPVNFYTSAGAGGFANMRMKIFEDGVLAPDNTTIVPVGRIGIMEEDNFRWQNNPIPSSIYFT